ncbi:MAG TPA: S41 family peptidase [Longimicrobiales bacterium]|nr:S41 family peptidase [Longimicrobiales bacterium]
MTSDSSTRTVLTSLLVLTMAILSACTEPVEPESEKPPTVEDREFDTGSRIDPQNLTAVQIENLALLAQVWGFAKYHHPRLVDGSHNWDYDLFRAVPLMLAAPDRASAAAALVTWLDDLGAIPGCSPCAQVPSDAYMQPDNGWIHDATHLGAALSERLVEMHRNRPVSESQRYISFTATGNPDFYGESYYHTLSDVDAGYRLLALFRFWNIIQYWFPYRDIMDEDWDGVLREFIPEMMQSMDGDTYRLSLIRLIGQIQDTHANLWSDLHVQPPAGSETAPLALRFVEGELVVRGAAQVEGLATGLERGDVIARIDGQSVESLVDSLWAWYPASNDAARLRDIARSITRGTGPVLLEGVGADGPFSTVAQRVPVERLWSVVYQHDLSGPPFRMLSDSVAYVKISSAAAHDAADYIAQAGDAAVLVIDCRGYPDEFLVFALGGHLVGGAVPFARFTEGDPTNPGAFLWTEPQVHSPLQPQFSGKVVILVDETTQSSAEYHAMAFRAAPNAIVVGSTTAGADGNVSSIPLPGGLRAMISGIGVFYPDGTPTQRVGIVPDLVVLPTIEGMRSGLAEVLDAGIGHALGGEFLSQN